MTKILVVDDVRESLDIMRHHLAKAGYEILTATDGTEVFPALLKHPDIELILLDRMMPRMSGIDVIKKLKGEDSQYKHIPIIMQSAATQPLHMYEGIDAGAINYVTKPYKGEMLLAAVGSVLQDIGAAKEKALEAVR